MSDDHLSLAHRCQRCLESYGGDAARAAKAMGMTVPTFRRYLAVLGLPVEMIAAYRQGSISQTLLWKLPRQPAAKLAALLHVLKQEGRLRHADLNALKGEPKTLMERFQATARQLKRGGMSEERLCELVRQA